MRDRGVRFDAVGGRIERKRAREALARTGAVAAPQLRRHASRGRTDRTLYVARVSRRTSAKPYTARISRRRFVGTKLVNTSPAGLSPADHAAAGRRGRVGFPGAVDWSPRLATSSRHTPALRAAGSRRRAVRSSRSQARRRRERRFGDSTRGRGRVERCGQTLCLFSYQVETEAVVASALVPRRVDPGQYLVPWRDARRLEYCGCFSRELGPEVGVSAGGADYIARRHVGRGLALCPGCRWKPGLEGCQTPGEPIEVRCPGLALRPGQVDEPVAIANLNVDGAERWLPGGRRSGSNSPVEMISSCTTGDGFGCQAPLAPTPYPPPRDQPSVGVQVEPKVAVSKDDVPKMHRGDELPSRRRSGSGGRGVEPRRLLWVVSERFIATVAAATAAIPRATAPWVCRRRRVRCRASSMSASTRSCSVLTLGLGWWGGAETAILVPSGH